MNPRALLLLLVAACGGSTPDPRIGGPLPPPAPDAAPAVAPAPDAGPVTPPSTAPAVARRDDGTVLIEGAPVIDAAISAELLRYSNTRSAGVRDLSDDGTRMLIGTRFADTVQLHVLRTPLGARTQLTFGLDPVGEASFVPGAPGSLLYTSDVGGDERHQIHRLELASGTTTRLTDGTSRNGGLLWSWSGKQLVWRSNARDPSRFDIMIGDGASAAATRILAQGTGQWSPVAWSRDDKRLLVGEYISVTESRLHLVDVASGTITPLTPAQPPAAYPEAVFSRDGKKIYLTSDREGEFQQLWELDLARQSWRSLTKTIPWDVEQFALSPDGTTLAVGTNEGGFSALRLIDTRSGAARKPAGMPRGLIGGLRFARKAPVLAMSMSGATSTGDAYTLHLPTGKVTRWTESEMGGLDRRALVEPSIVQFKTFDGAMIPSLYYRPAGAGKFPVVINIHGGPEGQSRPYFSGLTQFLVGKRGVAVLMPNVRGSTGYGKTFSTLDNGFKREDSVKDIGALLDWIATQPELDASRVAVLGGSYGGYMVLASMVHFADRLAAGIDVVGISNFVTFLENTGEYRRDLRRAEYGDERDPAMRKHLEQISPLRRAAEIRKPLFVAQGANDSRVPASEAEQIVAAVRGNGQDVWYMLARNEGHGFARKVNSDQYLALTVMFLDRHLVGR